MRTFIIATAAAAFVSSVFLATPSFAKSDGGDSCKDLRRACMYKERLGEKGEGNCKLYRRTCK